MAAYSSFRQSRNRWSVKVNTPVAFDYWGTQNNTPLPSPLWQQNASGIFYNGNVGINTAPPPGPELSIEIIELHKEIQKLKDEIKEIKRKME